MSINQAVIVGRLTKDPELKKTSGGVSSCIFTLAADRPVKADSNEQAADFIQCEAWRNIADYLCNYAEKGSKVAVCGSIRTGRYNNSQGITVYTTRVSVSCLELMEGKKSYDDKPYSGTSVSAKQIDKQINNEWNDSIKRQPKYQQQSADTSGWGNIPEINSNDLPF